MSDLLVYKEKYWVPYLTFDYVGAPEQFTLPAGKYLIECRGAFGGKGRINDYPKLPGGVSYGILDLNESKTMYAVVGGDGGDYVSNTVPGPGGYNGGAEGGKTNGSYQCGAGGGGATDIRLNILPDYERLVGYRTAPETCSERTYITADTFSGMYARIDTGVIHKSDTRIECVFSMPASASNNYEVIFGARNSPTNRAMVFFCRFDGEDRPTIGCNDAETRADFTIPRGQKLKVIFEGTTATIYDENGDLVGTIESTGSPQVDGEYTMGIFQQNNSNSWYDSSRCTIYSFKMWNGGELVRDMVPVSLQTYQVDTSSTTFVQGEITSSGTLNPSANNYVSTDFIEWPELGYYIKAHFEMPSYTPYWKVAFYDENHDFIGSDNNTRSSDTTVSLADMGILATNVKYVRLSVKGNMDAPMTPEDVLAFSLYQYINPNRSCGLFDLVSNSLFVEPSGYEFAASNVEVTPKTQYPVYEMVSPSKLSRIIVAGGGGGANNISMDSWDYPKYFGVGGGASGGPVSGNDANRTKCASQTGGYSFGDGQVPKQKEGVPSWGAEGSGGGGGGWYGGFAAVDNTASHNSSNGGGGSGYVVTSSSFKPSGYSDYVSSDYYFTGPLLLGGMSEGAGITIYKQQKNYASGDKLIFPCTGETQSIVLGLGEYVLKCWGGNGGPTVRVDTAARGGYAEGKLKTSDTHTIFVNVGGSGSRYNFNYNKSLECNPTTAFNGGGPADDLNDFRATFGGGASDIRVDTDSLYARIIVAGGGGGHGAGDQNGPRNGGAGGGLEGAWPNQSNYGTVPGPGTQTGTPTGSEVSGDFGVGGTGIVRNGGYGGAGGGGWYGGSGCIPDNSSNDDRGGCGGSGYVFTPTSNRPIGYLLDDSLVLTDTTLTQGGNNLVFGRTKVEIDVIETNFIQYLCKDEEGLKTFNKQQNEWVIIGNDDPTPEDLQEYGCYALKNMDELVGDIDLWMLDSDNTGLNNIHVYVIPPKQIITTTKYTQNLVSSISMDADIDTDNVDFKTTINRKGSYEDSRIDMTLECDIHDQPTMKTKMYAIHAYTQGQASYQIPQKKEKTLQHIDLLSVGIGNSVPLRYKAYLGTHIEQDEAITTINSAVSCERNRNIYSCVVCNNKVVRFVKLSLVNNHSTILRDIPITSLGGSGKRYGDIIVDDEYMYITYYNNNAFCTLYRIPLDPSGEITSYAPGNNDSRYSFQAYGKMEWYNDHTIIFNSRYGFILFDTETLQWTEKSRNASSSRDDFAVGKKYAVSLLDNTSKNMLACDIETNTWIDLENIFSGNYRNMVCYGDGKFYVVQRNTLHIVDEMSLEVEERIVTPFSSDDPYSIDYTNRVLYILIRSSNILYIYDIKDNRWTQLYLPFTIGPLNTSSSTYNHRSCAFKGFHFIPDMRLYTSNFVEYTKYNLGYKYDTFSFVFNNITEPDYDYDIRFVSFSDDFMTINNGYVDFPMNLVDPENMIFKGTIASSEYNKIINVTLTQVEDDNEGDDNNG